jgi:hypothetical protein
MSTNTFTQKSKTIGQQSASNGDKSRSCCGPPG